MNSPPKPKNRPYALLAAAWLSVVLVTTIAASAAVVRTVDGVTLDGDLTSVADGKLFVAVASTQPSARASTRPTTAPATAVPLDDIGEVVLRKVPPSIPTTPAAGPDMPPPPPRSHGLFAAIVSSLVGSDDSSDSAPGPAVAAPPPPPPTHAAGPVVWRVVLADGDRLRGTVTRWADGTVELRPSAAGGATVRIPIDRLTQIWAADAAAQAKARATIHDAGVDDVAWVRKDGDSVASVSGTAMGLDGDALRFRYDGRDRRIAVAKLVGVVFGGRRPATRPTDGVRFTAELAGGDAVSGVWTTLDRQRLTLRTDWGKPLPLAVEDVFRLHAVGGRLAYLSDLTPAHVEQVPFFGRVVPYRLDRSLAGGPIRLADGTHDKGIAVHARCQLDYDLGGTFDRFRTVVGFEQPTGRDGRAVVRVLADGRPLYESVDARGDRPPVPLDLDVTGVQRLALLVDFGPEQDVQARVDWADARLVRRRPTPSSRPTTREVRP